MNGNHRGHNDCSGKITGVGVLTTVLISRTDGILLRVFFYSFFFRSVFNEIGLCFSSYRGIYSLSIGRAQRDEKCRLIFFAMPTVYYVFLTSYSTFLQRDTALRTVYYFFVFNFNSSLALSLCVYKLYMQRTRISPANICKHFYSPPLFLHPNACAAFIQIHSN